MIRIALAHMRLSLGTLVPAGIAVALGTSFVAFALIAGNVMTRSSYDLATARLDQADLVVSSPRGMVDASALATARDAIGANDVEPLISSYVDLSVNGRSRYVVLIPVTARADLNPLVVVDGVEPTSADQVALPVSLAERWRVEIGQTVTVGWWQVNDDGPTKDGHTAATVVGLTDDPSGAFVAEGGAGLASPDALDRWSGNPGLYDGLMVAAQEPSAARAALSEALPELVVQTRDEAATEQFEQLSGGSKGLVMTVLGFAAISMFVAGLVIANTFQVLVAQRTRTLALLRCIGARRRQIRVAVLTEGAVLGLAASVVGLALGMGVSQVALMVVRHIQSQVPLPAVVPITVGVFIWPLLVGTVVTVLAALVPARVAGAVSPIAALRPAGAPAPGSARQRFAVSLMLTVVGGAAALVAAVSGMRSEPGLTWFGVGFLGSGLCFLGVMIGAVLWVPLVMASLDRVGVGRRWASVRLAMANVRRNPRRSAATSTALLIGVTLVVTMSTGAVSARLSLDAMLDGQFPVDLEVQGFDESGLPVALEPGVREQVAGIDGIAQAAEVQLAEVQISQDPFSAYGVDPTQVAGVLKNERIVEALLDGQAVVPDDAIRNGQVTLTYEQTSVTVPATAWPEANGVLLISTSTMRDLRLEPPTVGVWASLAEGAHAGDVLADVQDALGDQPLGANSAAAERESYQRLIDVMLMIVLGLLGVAVVIAVIGVTNTLALSVLERRRELATLRAVGMTRRQLRASLATEGVLMSLVGAVVGAVLGIGFGWVGAAVMFGESTQMAVPWPQVTAVVTGAIVAGLVASVAPGRNASRTSPVAALAEE